MFNPGTDSLLQGCACKGIGKKQFHQQTKNKKPKKNENSPKKGRAATFSYFFSFIKKG
jgi:hypothetical protein